MVFSSVPVYLDPPNWHHQLQSYLQSENVAASSQLQLPPLPPPSYGNDGGGSGPGSIKPGSMSDLARQAKLQPETVLKCPRCESANTKFCYFNNYNLSQPRHFCKTCRRFWTRGGALRKIPAGGGCRRNKKSKNSSTSSSSSSPSKSQAAGTIVSSSSTPPRDHSLMGHHFPQQPPQLPFLSSLQNLSQLGSLNLRGIVSVSANNSIMSADQWSSVQQFPFLPGGFDQSAGNYDLFSFQNGAATTAATSTRVCDQVKMKETLNSGSGRQFLGISSDNNNSNNNEYYSSSNSSTDQLTGQQLSSSSLATTHFLEF